MLMMTALLSNGQNYWNKVSSGTSKNLLSISFGSPSIGYIGGMDSLLLKTTDGGNTWSQLSFSGMNFSGFSKDIIHVNFPDADTGFAVVSNFIYPTYLGELYMTTDGGATWTLTSSGGIASYSTWFADSRNGYIVGSAFFAGSAVAQLTNGNWSNTQHFSSGPSQFLYSIDCRQNICLAAGSSGYVYRSRNNGVVWDTVKTVTDSAIRCVRFADNRTIIAATDDPMGGVMVSNDTGNTWHYENNLLTFFYPQMKSVAISKLDSFIVVGKVNWDTTGIILWPNGSFATEQEMHSVSMRDDSIAFTVGNKGLIMRNMPVQVGIRNVQGGGVSVKAYPNPSSNGQFTAVAAVPYTWKVYDITGKRISTGDDPKKIQQIDISGQPKGIYLLEVSTATHHSYQKLIVE